MPVACQAARVSSRRNVWLCETNAERPASATNCADAAGTNVWQRVKMESTVEAIRAFGENRRPLASLVTPVGMTR